MVCAWHSRIAGGRARSGRVRACAMAALKAGLLALLAAVGSAQSPSCIDTDATVRA